MATILKRFVTPQKNAWECVKELNAGWALWGSSLLLLLWQSLRGRQKKYFQTNVLPSMLLGDFCSLDSQKRGRSCESGTCQLLLQRWPGGLDTQVFEAGTATFAFLLYQHYQLLLVVRCGSRIWTTPAPGAFVNSWPQCPPAEPELLFHQPDSYLPPAGGTETEKGSLG